MAANTYAPISKVKTFTIQKREEKNCAPKKGMLIYHALDEKGDPRKIAVIISYGFRGKVKSIKPVYEREALIVQSFKTMSDGESVTIGFETNTVRKAVRHNERHIYQDAYDDAALISSVNNFSSRVSFYLKVFSFAVVAFLIVYALISVNTLVSGLKGSH